MTEQKMIEISQGTRAFPCRLSEEAVIEALIERGYIVTSPIPEKPALRFVDLQIGERFQWLHPDFEHAMGIVIRLQNGRVGWVQLSPDDEYEGWVFDATEPNERSAVRRLGRKEI